jgi:superfamily I DNA/RNA helicase
MPAVFGGVFPRFPLVLIDEYQDLNPVNLALVDHLVKLRVIGVGDDAQSIYGFRGAVQGGMATAIEKFKMAELPLSTSFRCPRAIVENARWRVPEFKWIKPGGHVEHLKDLATSDISDDAVILCRNNAPLFSTALRLLSIGRSVSVAGSDIGPKLIGLMRKLGPESLNQDQAIGAINDWKAEKVDKGSTTAEDMASCMRVFVDAGSDLGQAIRYAEHVLSQKGSIRLMTGHKAKGLEWKTVFHLDPWLCREEEQDRNLRYVIQTRSMDQYYEINSKAINWGT